MHAISSTSKHTAGPGSTAGLTLVGCSCGTGDGTPKFSPFPFRMSSATTPASHQDTDEAELQRAYLKRWPRLSLLEKTNQVKELHTIIRDKHTTGSDFIFYADRLIRLVVEEGLNQIECTSVSVTTPTGSDYSGVDFLKKICGVSIMRAGEAMEKGLRDCCRSVRIGKILIQRDTESNQPQLYYAKFPPDIAERQVMLFDPQLGTGGTACKAIDVLISHGVPQHKILFVTVIACPKGVDRVFSQYPKLRMVASEIDSLWDEKGGILPGCGDFGNRYFRTDDDEEPVTEADH